MFAAESCVELEAMDRVLASNFGKYDVFETSEISWYIYRGPYGRFR